MSSYDIEITDSKSERALGIDLFDRALSGNHDEGNLISVRGTATGVSEDTAKTISDFVLGTGVPVLHSGAGVSLTDARGNDEPKWRSSSQMMAML